MKIKLVKQKLEEENIDENSITLEDSNDINKYKSGVAYTSQKVRVIRNVKLSNGHVFPRNYWINTDQIKPGDKIVGQGSESSVSSGINLEGIANIRQLYVGTQNNKISNSTQPISVIENAKNLVNKILNENNSSPLENYSISKSSDMIKKLALIEQKLQAKDISEADKVQLNTIKTQLKAELNNFYENGKKFQTILPKIKEHILNLYNKRNKQEDSQPIHDFLPDWLIRKVEVRSNISADIPAYNFNTKKIEINKNAKIDQQHMSNAIGHKIEQTQSEIANLSTKFLDNRNWDFSAKVQQYVVKKEKENIDIEPDNVIPLSKIYPDIGYTNQKGYGFNFIDPCMGEYYKEGHTNLISNGLQLLMKDSALKSLFLLDPDYLFMLLGICISEKGEEE